jgi:hypothetical protein
MYMNKQQPFKKNTSYAVLGNVRDSQQNIFQLRLS